MQPPLHPTGFYQNDNGALVPLYHPDALLSYQLGKTGGQAQGDSPNQSSAQQPSQQQPQQPQPQAQPVQAQQQVAAGWYPTMPMAPYAYQYPPVPFVQPGQVPQQGIPPSSSGSSYPVASGWGHPSQVPPRMQQNPPSAAQQQQQATPPPYGMAPSMSASSVNMPPAFGVPVPSYPVAAPGPAMNYQQPPDQAMGPRHGMANNNNNSMRFSRNQGHGYQNRNPSNRFSRPGGGNMGGFEPSQSFVDPTSQRRHSQQQMPVQMSGSYPGQLAAGT